MGGASTGGGNGDNRPDRTNPNKPAVSYSAPKKNNFGRVGENAGSKKADAQYQRIKPKPKPKPILPPVAMTPTTMEIDQAQSTEATDKSYNDKKTTLRNNKKGRTNNILTSAAGLGNNNLVIKKTTLGAG